MYILDMYIQDQILQVTLAFILDFDDVRNL